LTFPCSFPVKAIGLHTEDFEANVVTIIRRHAPDLSDDAITSRNSGGGRYLAVTATIIATSREQLDAIYLELNSHQQVVWVL
jgi:putative lipoic acid-binding regulatory protein